MALRQIIFFTVLPALWIWLHVVFARRVLRDEAPGPTVRRIVWGVVLLLAGLPVVTFVALRGGGARAYEPIQWAGYLAMGLSSIALVLWVAVGVVTRVGRLASRLRGGSQPDPSRRTFLGRAINLGIAGTAGSVTAVGVASARQLPELVEVEVPIAGLPPQADGLVIVQITDVHVGPTIHGEYLSAVVDRVNGLDADIVAVTGDLIDGRVEEIGEEVAALGRIEARHGVFFVTGNHEYYWDGPAWCAHVQSLGLTVLLNEHRVIEHEGARLVLAGVTDISAGGMVPSHASSPAKACEGAPDGLVKILLAHQPRSIAGAAAAGFDLQISGHTHGGQYFPMNLLVYLAQPYVAGLAKHDDTWIYVSRGTGYWGPPIRAGAPHEITRLRLVAA